jgi:hypothetical protein
MPTADTEVTWTQLEQLPYLSAVLNEGLRMASPAISGLPRIARPRKPPIRFLVHPSWNTSQHVVLLHALRPSYIPLSEVRS